MSTTTTVTKMPNCDVCSTLGRTTPAQYDARTRQGPWAYMCQACFDQHGVGLGTGKGQRLVLVAAGSKA